MKRCKKCSAAYEDSFDFCPVCGETLTPAARPFPWRLVIAAVCVLAAFLVIRSSFRESSQIQTQRESMAQQRSIRAAEEERNTPKTSDLTIASDWTARTERSYLYIEGTISNISSKDIRYYKIGVRFLDRFGNVIDTDWTNGTDLGAWESTRFEIMHKRDCDYTSIELYVKEVR